MSGDPNVRTEEDLERVVRAIADAFETDTVIIIGSQAILMSWPDAPEDMRGTPEIDAYPGNAKIWEAAEAARGDDGPPPEASEHINALFGWGSPFHTSHGFYIDGVDEMTAKLPRNWQSRAAVRSFKTIAPSPDDLIVSKLARLDDKDKDFVEAYHRERKLDVRLIDSRIAETDLGPVAADRAIAYIRGLVTT